MYLRYYIFLFLYISLCHPSGSRIQTMPAVVGENFRLSSRTAGKNNNLKIYS